MGWFSWTRRHEAARPAVPADPSRTAPLSAERIRDWLRAKNYAWFIDLEGDTGGLWRGRLFYFFTLGEHGEILQVRGQWNRSFTIERLTEVLEICNDWNTDRVWPKAYLRVRDDGSVHAICEVATDLGAGVTDDQLSELLSIGLRSAAAFFDQLDERYPDPAGQAP